MAKYRTTLFAALAVAAASSAPLPPLPTYAPKPHIDAIEVFKGHGKSEMVITARDCAGRIDTSVNCLVTLEWGGRSERGEFLEPATNVIRLVDGRGRALVRRPLQSDQTVTRLSFKPDTQDVLPTQIVLADFEDEKAVWIRSPHGGAPFEVPASSVTNDFKVSIRCNKPFHLYSGPAELMVFEAIFKNQTSVPRKVTAECRVMDWDGKKVVERCTEADVAAGGVLRECVEFNPLEPRGIYFVESTVREAGRELAFSRTNLARLPPHTFTQDAEHSIFGLSAYVDVFWGHEAMQDLMDRLGVRWLRTGDRRVQHAGRCVNYQNGLKWKTCMWKEAARDEFIRAQFAYLGEHGGKRLEWGNEVNLQKAVAVAGDGVGKCVFAKEYISWVKSIRRVMDEQGYGNDYELIGMGMAGFDHPFATKMRESGVLAMLDGFCLHPAGSQYVPDFPYGFVTNAPPERACGPHPGDRPTLFGHRNFLGSLRATRDWLDKYAPGMPLWLTEMYAGSEPNCRWNGMMRDGADTVLLQYALAAAEGVRAGMFWVMCSGIPSDPYGVKPGNREYTFGLINRDTSLKPSAMGYAAASEALEGAQFKGWMKLEDPKTHGLLFDTPRGPVAVMWARWDGYWLTWKSKDGFVRHRDPWLERWPTKRSVPLPAAGDVMRIDSIGRGQTIASVSGVVQIPLSGSPCIIYGLDASRIGLVLAKSRAIGAQLVMASWQVKQSVEGNNRIYGDTPRETIVKRYFEHLEE